MSNYAKIENDIVVNVVVCDDSSISSLNGEYVKITDNTNNPTIGSIYYKDKNKFTDMKIYESWVLNEDTCLYEAPVEKPQDGEYYWDEDTTAFEFDGQLIYWLSETRTILAQFLLGLKFHVVENDGLTKDESITFPSPSSKLI